MKTNKKGISLIVLVITIVVMIIIAAAVILYLDESKVVRNAEKAVTMSNVSTAKEVVTVAKAEWRINKNKIIEDKKTTTLKEYAEYKLEEAGFEIGDNGGQVGVTESGLLKAYFQPIIPTGYVTSNVSSEDEVSEGLVIYEGVIPVTDNNVEEAQKTRNQYVWIPVPNMSEFVRMEGYANSERQTFLLNPLTSEPYAYDSLITENDDKTGEYAEYAKMKASVAKYGGFYIARYEAGTTNKRENIANGTSFKSDGVTPDVLSQKDKYVYNYVAWGPSMTSVTGDVTYNSKKQGKGAVELSRGIYPESSNKGVVSTLVYGVQWDAAMKFVEDIENPFVEGKKYIEDSTSMGWYSNNKDGNTDHKTGIDVDANKKYNMVKNIYDMEGNVGEITMETGYKKNYRILRGGYYNTTGSEYPVSRRTNYYCNTTGTIYGFRVALYLK